MDHFPIELIQRIYTQLDLASLRNAALSCRIFLNAFKNAEVLITSEIALRGIGLDVLPEAILVHESRDLGKPSTDPAIQFAQHHLSSRAPAPTQWRLADALPLERLHRCVDYFASLYSAEALSKQPRLLSLGEPSYAERLRFQRAFYRFQLYCNLVGRRVTDGPGLRDMYFGHFAAWESEQLACVYEYLMRVIAKRAPVKCHITLQPSVANEWPAFNCLVEHDVSWGFHKVPYVNRYYSDHGQYILSEGLEKLYLVSQGSSYQDWHDVLSRGEDMFDEPFSTSSFLYNGLFYGANVYPIYGDSLSELDEEDRQDVIGSPFYNEADRGPASIWEWVHKDQLPGSLVGETRRRLHRQWAYTFWDASRLESAGLLTDPSISGDGPHTELGLEEYDTPERRADLESSQAARAKLWVRGGSGWWSATDETKVVWPKPDPLYTRVPIPSLQKYLPSRIPRKA